ncbi:interferon alpha-inducible protein 27-like protein 2A, partial [Emys orbicularis]|uniref:interferon alpha-inducible protein 27-like protein 2A n=1 Tax=Emys orbicularis TaxID=82168 RepID=UPI0031FBB79A
YSSIAQQSIHSAHRTDAGGFIPIAVGATVGLGVATVAVPVALGAAGFTGAGIAAGTLAAKMMSAAAVANGGGVAAGSTVAVLQSVGAAGLSLATKGAVTAVGGVLSFFYPK